MTDGNRTRILCVTGRRPKPLDDGHHKNLPRGGVEPPCSRTAEQVGRHTACAEKEFVRTARPYLLPTPLAVPHGHLGTS